ncbi:MAG: PilZ domain-containing protein [Spirochaetaceae bacterium]|jgi:hypothetical protein|nr:PilZ domain-containing protein [Spirochaetaceae bacterium]
MKLLLVLGSSEVYKQIAEYVKELGAELVHYQHILKAMDNIDEISPDGVIVSATDFPRHWKTLISFIRASRPPEVCAAAVLYGQFFSDKERKKAKILRVNCLLNEARLDRRSLNQLRETLRPYISAVEWVTHLAVRPKDSKKLTMIITNPLTGALVPGKVIKISQDGVVFMPEHPRLTKNLALMTELPGCSLRAGSTILAPVCRVIRNEESVTLEFTLFKPHEKQKLRKFLSEEPDRLSEF